MKTIFTASILFLASLGAGLAQQGTAAQSYNYLDFGYERSTSQGLLGEVLDDSNGFALDLMVSPAQSFILATEYHYARPDVGGDSVNMHDLKLGLGGYLPLGDKVSFYTHVGGRYLRTGTDIPGLNPSEWGVYVEPGVRVTLGDSFEIYGAGEYTRIFEDNLWGAKAGGIFYFNPNLGFEVFGRFSDDWTNSYGAGVRIGW